MSPDAYLEMAETEAAHWWFRARRDVLRTLLDRLTLPRDARVLEVGSGTGGNLEMLAGFGTVSGLEMDATARALSARKTGGQFDIRAGHCPDDVPFQRERFDLICFFDCLEHIADDSASLARMQTLLTPGGRIVVTVPAGQKLWSAHDVFLHHFRRYSRASLQQCAAAAGYEVERISYFNTLLYPLAVAARWADRVLRRRRSSGDAIPPAPLNAALYRIFRAERHWLARAPLPYGVSLFAILRKRDSASAS
ncbi:class I SAM-dependent methyltransferase [Paraburkholderia sp. MMS20-SJTR3]|uniref:Class I SAM-dependent methyltransferase n=1 Tax=Paraburkholderia sejongensis TaxID=2886946 RepID=A0ABS8JRZ9_9BURK|nr:class I SAM-dependent methyltransferase [Paraburkholderia sp. MMS20-SJTR3]MCC8392680.1 class I SAM-dependent methyltransferase [Paraburkholderia sp. MMS20-SJTR3]